MELYCLGDYWYRYYWKTLESKKICPTNLKFHLFLFKSDTVKNADGVKNSTKDDSRSVKGEFEMKSVKTQRRGE